MTEKKRQLITTSEIASLAGVDASTVSNWRRRFDGAFPQPVLADDEGKRPKFDRDEIIEWLRQNPQVGSKGGDARRGLRRVVELLHEGGLGSDSHADIIGRLLELITRNRRAGQLRDFLSAEAIRRSLADVSIQREQTAYPVPESLLADGVLESVYQNLVDVADPLAFYDDALFHRQNRLSDTAQSSTPALLADFLAALAQPSSSGSVLDPVAGFGTLLLSCLRTGKARTGFGVDVNQNAVEVANRRLFLANADGRVEHGDSLIGESSTGMNFELVVADPPLGMQLRGDPLSDIRWEFGIPKPSNADTAWLQRAVSRLTAGGRAIVVTTITTLFQHDKQTAQIRNEMVRRGAVEAVFTLPARLRTNTAVRLAVWVLTTPDAPARRKSVLLVDLGTDDLTAVAPDGRGIAAFRAWADNVDTPLDPSFAVAVPVTDLLAPDATLVPSRWITAPEDHLDAGGWKRQTEQSYRAATASLDPSVHLPSVAIEPSKRPANKTTVGELLKRGSVTVVRGRHIDRYDGGAGNYPILTVRDARVSRPDQEQATDRVAAGPATEAQLVLPGDVLVYPDGDRVQARVWTEPGWVIGRFMQVIRIHNDSLNPHFVAASISSPFNQRHLIEGNVRTHFDLLDFEIAVVPPEAQRAAELVSDQFGMAADRLAEAQAAVDAAKTELLTAIASGLVRADVR